MTITLKTAAVLLPALALTGCITVAAPSGQGASRAPTTATAAPTATATPTPSQTPAPSTTASRATAPSASSTAQEVPGVTFTPPDTELTFGQKAVVPHALSDRVGALGITVTAIDKGAPEDLAPFHLGDRAKGLTPYYIKVLVTNETGADFGYISLGLTTPVLGDGSPAQKLDVIRRFEPCPNDSAAGDFNSRGAQFRTCVVGLAASEAEVTGLAYSGSAYGKVKNEPDYGLDPVFWKGRPSAAAAAKGPTA